MSIHATAIVEDGARLGAGVEVGPFCIVGRNTMLAEGVRLHSHVVIAGHAEIGARCELFPNVVLGTEAQIRGGNAPDARLIIGADCVLRENVTMSCGSARGGRLTSIGERGYFMAGSHVGHDCHLGNDVTLVNGALFAGHVEVGDNVLIGGGAAIQQFTRIGSGAFLSGLSGCALDIIPYGEAIGSPHARLGGLNLIGLKRRGVPRPRIHALRAAFHMIFVENTDAIADGACRAKEKWPDMEEVQEVCAFILAPAKKAIMPYRRRGRSDEA
ncbi:MAG TPA: acyl-ACP--UDP-N-acetylglucosamine O-acyltransferase [Rhizomicrobium sp.]|jgi:UDP-N-acetylglucosamine acyltransferase